MKGVIVFITLLHLVATAKAVDAKNCSEKCGNMAVSYPFGIKDGCFLEGFNIICDETTGKAYYKDEEAELYEIIDISLSQAVMRIYFGISFACYNRSGGNTEDGSLHHFIHLNSSPFRYSITRNKFTAIGCRTIAYIYNPFPSPGQKSYISGCISICDDPDKIIDYATCSGNGCCQTAISKELDYYTVRFDHTANHSDVWSFSPCSYAFLVDKDWYKFNQSDLFGFKTYYRNNKVVPIVLDWAIGKVTCEEAKLDKKANYSCISSNSVCKNSINRLGYTCNCQNGYEGNPYIYDGCKDVDECKTEMMPSPCYGDCKNSQGSYECLCPLGTYGNASIEGSCKAPSSRKLTTTTIVIIIIVGLSSFPLAAIMYLIYGKTKLNKAKEKCFRQNGGLLLQAQINAHESVRFRIFSIKEIMKATNNFDEASIVGRGGQGVVYEGIIDCRVVAIKKSIMIDEKRMKEFVKEMYILSLINHKNVVQILGCCLEVEVPILVYEFVSKGTLYQRIQEKNQRMSLGYRLQIAIDSASALMYLHYDSFPPIIHGDIKSSNILLDENNIAKISDFGASMLPLKEINETGVPGTYGYLDPESLITGQLTKKSDVYSFAVVVLELLTRMKALYYEKSGEKRNLAHTFEKEGLEKILDDEIKYVMTREQISEFSELLNMCLKIYGSERPTMKKVVAWLRRMQEFDPKLSDETEDYNVQSVHAESSNHTSYTTQFYSSGNRAVFDVNYHLTR